MNDIIDILDSTFYLVVLLPIIIMLIKNLIDFFINRSTDKSLDEAKAKAFQVFDQSYVDKLSKIKKSHDSLEEKSTELENLIKENENRLKISNLLNFYNEQIKIYQKNTQSRASWSFTFAIIAMFFGLFFIILGSILVINKSNTGEIIALTSLATLGGAISGYIAKTFLDVHKTSLNQLNRYFKEPLINQYILKSQLLTEELESEEKKQLISKLFDITTDIVRKNSDFN